MPRSLLLAAIAASAFGLAAPGPAAAQAQGADERMNMVIVYGEDECPQPKDGEITVCARKAESERYRIPEPLRGSASPQNEAWTQRVKSYERVSKTGTQSCSASGPGGWTGCVSRFIQTNYAAKKDETDVHFSEMITKEREKRAATLDADAAATQARVEQAEKEYDARKRAEAEAAEGAKGAQPATTAAPAAPAPQAKVPVPAAEPAKPGKSAKKAAKRKAGAPQPPAN